MAAITTAEARKRGLFYKTPLVESVNLSKAAGCRIFLKLDNLQPSGAFKSRGLGFFCAKALSLAKDPSKVHFYSSSGGNAGLACVRAANTLGCPSTVVVPSTTKEFMIAKIKAAGASEVIQEGKSWKFADAHLRDVVMKQAEDNGEEAIYVSPFDHPDIWSGHETLVEEIKDQFEELGEQGQADVIVCSAGGAGLFVGIAQGLARIGWNDTQILVMGTHGANAFSASIEAGEHTTISGITSQATSLGAIRVADRAFELGLQRHRAGTLRTHLLSDSEAAMGCWRFADDERLLVELACGVNVALCYDGRLSQALGRAIQPTDRIVIEVCGGSNVSTQMVETWRQEFGLLNGHADEMVPSAKNA